MSLTFKADINLYATDTQTKGINSVSSGLQLQPRIQYTNGSGANQASKMLTGEFTIAASGTKVVNLTTDVDAYGAALAMTIIKAIYVYNASTTDPVTMGGGGTDVSTIFADATEKLRIVAGGYAILIAPTAAGYAVTATTADKITFTNTSSTNTLTFKVAIIGA